MLELNYKIKSFKKIISLFLIGVIAVASSSLNSYGQAVENFDLKQEGLGEFETDKKREKLFVHTDKNFYLAGETLWFKVYCMDEDNKRSGHLSKVAYLEVLDKENEAVLQAKVALNKDKGHGSWFLPATLKSGNYIVRGYTNWMKNFSPGYYFEAKITIVNSIVPAEHSDAEIATKKEDVSIQFFPEGGSLLSGLDNKVAFRLVDGNGKGFKGNGVLVNQEGDTITSLQPLKFGIGNFSFKPAANNSYKALFRNQSGKLIQQELPRVRESGYGLQLQELEGGKVNVEIRNTSTSGQESVYLLMHSKQKVKIAKKASLTNGKADIVLEKAEMGDGVNHITIFNNAKSPVCERLYFKQPVRQKLRLELATDQGQYAFRQKVTLNMLAQEQDARPVAAEVSVAVYKVDSLQQHYPADIYSYLWLGSELQGEVESPGWYFTEEGALMEEAMDNLMLTHGWRRINLLENEKKVVSPAFKFLPEYEGHLITGQILAPGGESGAGNRMVYLSVPGKNFQLYGARSKEDGSLIFNARNYYGEGEIVVLTDSEEGGEYNIKINSPFSKEFSGRSLPEFKLEKELKDQLLDNSLAMQVQNVYRGSELRKPSNEKMPYLPYYGGGYDESYLLDDYTRFPTMEEVIREYVKGIRIKRQDGKLNLRAVNQHTELSFGNDPLMLVNGVPVFDSQKILELDPYKLEEIGVVTNTYYNGPLVSEGVVNFSTYKGDLAEVSLDPEAVVLDYEGLQLAREFFTPVYESHQQQASRLPDFRNVLLWLPEAETEEDGTMKVTFYTSDVAGTYVVVVQCLADDGKAGSANFLFEAGGAL